MFADTPPTFVLVFGWVLLAFAAPIAAVVAIILVIRRKTRRIGSVLLLLGTIGSLVAALAMHSIGTGPATFADWLFAAAGGFTLFGVSAALIVFERSRQKS